MAQKKTVLTIGTCSMTLSLQATKLPKENETAQGVGVPVLSCDGRAGNSALALLSFGVQSMLCSTVGKDLFAQQLLSFYEKKGLDCSFVERRDDVCTELCVRTQASAEQKTQVCYTAACDSFSEERIEQALAQKPDMLLLSLDIPFERVYFAIRCAKQRGIAVVLDATNMPPNASLTVLDTVDAVIIDEQGVQQLTGVYPGGVDDCMRASLALAKAVKARYYIMHLADRGCYLYDGRLPHFIAAYRTVLKDTRCATEAFCAALCAALGTGADMNAACYFATAAYCLTAAKEGAAESLPTLSEISYLMTGKA